MNYIQKIFILQRANYSHTLEFYLENFFLYLYYILQMILLQDQVNIAFVFSNQHIIFNLKSN